MLKVNNLSLTYEMGDGRTVTAVEGVDMTVESGQIVSIIGPSGCGKSTLLHCIGGLISPTIGNVTVDGVEVNKPDPTRSAFVFQDYSLFPWTSVVENAATGLRFAGVNKRERRSQAMERLKLVGLSHVADSYPNELSGGMQQRVSIARALVMDPGTLLLDEPFGALDEQTRRRLGVEMSEILTEAGKTVIMVTHSLDEAVFWADHVLVMGNGPRGKVIRKLDIETPRPRRVDFMTSPSFDRLRSELFEHLETPNDSISHDPNAAGQPVDSSSGIVQ